MFDLAVYALGNGATIEYNHDYVMTYLAPFLRHVDGIVTARNDSVSGVMKACCRVSPTA